MGWGALALALAFHSGLNWLPHPCVTSRHVTAHVTCPPPPPNVPNSYKITAMRPHIYLHYLPIYLHTYLSILFRIR